MTEVKPNVFSQFAARLTSDRRLLVLIVGVVVVAGLSSVTVLPRMEDPVLAQRVAIINTTLPGADASRVEALVTEKIEDSLRDIKEIREIRSQSRPGISNITVELLDQIVDTDPVWSKVRGKIEDALPELPAEASRPEFDELEVRAYARIVSLVWIDDAPVDYAVLRRTAKQLQDRLQAVPGTEAVDRYGDPGEEVIVRVDARRAAAIGLSIPEIANQLAAADAKEAAGQVRGERRDLSLELENQFDEVGAIGRTTIRSADGQFTRLDQVADVAIEAPTPLPRWARFGDDPAISLGVLIRPETRIDLWSLEADNELERYAKLLPAGLKLREVMDQAEYVQVRLSSLATNLALGGAAVCVVVLLLMGWRSAIVVASALPLTVLAVLFGMRVMGIPVHQMSITGMIIALGLLIDNAIVIADEIRMELEEGVSPIDAASIAVRKLTVPLWGSTLTTALAFAPIALMPGPAGEFVGSIALNVITAIVASLVFSLTVIAAIAALWIKVGPAYKAGTGWRRVWQQGLEPRRLGEFYGRTLSWLLHRPVFAICVSVAPALLGFAVAPLLSEQFFPPADRDQFHIEVELGPGTAMRDTERVSLRIDEILRSEPVASVDWFYGDAAPTFYYNVVAARRGNPGFAQAIVKLEPTAPVGEVIRRLQQRFDETITSARVLARQLEQGPPFSAPVEVRFFGPDVEKLRELGDEARQILVDIPRVTHTASALNETLPRVTLDVDEHAARIGGLSPGELAAQARASLDGVLGGSVVQETEQLPIRVRLDDESRNGLHGAREIELLAGIGSEASLIPLRAVAETHLMPETGVIVRLNRRRMNEVGAYLEAGTLPSQALAEFERRWAAAGLTIPLGYQMAFGGEASKRNDAVGNLMASVGVLMAMMVTTLVLSFSSFRLAGLIGAVGVLSVGLGLGALWIGGYPFGFMAIIGAMGLVGVAINDSIVVLATLRDEHGREVSDVSEIVKSTQRCTRHVMATTLTTVAGFAPLIWDGGEFWPPLAVAIAGGVVGATFLALVFIPAAYRLAYCRVTVS